MSEQFLSVSEEEGRSLFRLMRSREQRLDVPLQDLLRRLEYALCQTHSIEQMEALMEDDGAANAGQTHEG